MRAPRNCHRHQRALLAAVRERAPPLGADTGQRPPCLCRPAGPGGVARENRPEGSVEPGLSGNTRVHTRFPPKPASSQKEDGEASRTSRYVQRYHKLQDKLHSRHTPGGVTAAPPPTGTPWESRQAGGGRGMESHLAFHPLGGPAARG